MRKRFKIKKYSCGLCKPYKIDWVNRWNYKEFVKVKDFEKEKRRFAVA